MTAGDTFGENAIITCEKSLETIVCREDTHVMAIEKEHFVAIFGGFFYKIMGEKLEFLRKFPFFRNLPESLLLIILS